jgi:hypothetical protein
MSEPIKKKEFPVRLVIGVVASMIIAGIAAQYFFSEEFSDTLLAQKIQNDYSVPVDVRIINTSEGKVAYIVPGEVKWDFWHKRLLYNLSDPKEVTLAFIETMARRDAKAFEFLLSPYSKEGWSREGYNEAQILDAIRPNYRDIDKPYAFGFEMGETNLSLGFASVLIKYASYEIELELKKQPDGTWKV